MPSPFPGMDPFIEGQVWPGFHTQFIAQLQRELAPRLRPRYATFIEERIYLLSEPGVGLGSARPDAAIIQRRGEGERLPAVSAAVAVLEAPFVLDLPPQETERIVHLEIRRTGPGDVVCVIELLSPTNKQPGLGRQEYLAKRAAVLDSPAHLVELDVLRGGLRLPMQQPLPPGDYYTLVSRADQRPHCGVWAWSLQETLPKVQIPLDAGDLPLELDLQRVFTQTYEAAGYEFTLDYGAQVVPPAAPDVSRWITSLTPGQAG